jgi:hypothetical protein
MADVNSFVQNYIAGMQGASKKYSDGVSRVTVSPTQTAAQHLDSYVANTAAAVSSGRMANALNRVSLQSWQQSAIAKSSRLGHSSKKTVRGFRNRSTMSYHTLVYQSNSTATTLTQINAVSDPSYAISNNNFLPPGDRYIYAAYSQGVNLTQSTLQVADYIAYSQWNIQPVVTASTVPTNPNYCNMLFQPPKISALNQLQCNASSSSGTNSITTVVFLGSNPQPDPIPFGNIITVRATASVTLVSNSWTSLGTLVFDTALPGKRFAVVGGFGQSAGAIAFRLLFPGGDQAVRPGGLCVTSIGNRVPNEFMLGYFGQLGTFFGPVPPSCEFFSGSADSTEKIFLQLVPLN